MSMSVEVERKDDVATLIVTGEVDVSNADELRGALDELLAEDVSCIELDVSDMAYIDSTGIGVLVGFAHKAQEAELELALVNPQANVLRVLSLLALDEELGVRVDDSDAALRKIAATDSDDLD